MASLMVPTAGPAQGITNRLNTFESDFSGINAARARQSQEAAKQQQLISNAIGMATAAHNAANDALVLDYSNRLEREHQELLTGLQTKNNKDAIDAYQPTLDAMKSAVERYSEELKDADPSVKLAFTQAAQRLSLRSSAAVDAYVIQQSKKYRTNELKARVDLAAEDVARNFANPVLRSAALERWEAARKLQDADLGIEWGSAQSKAADLESMSSIYANKANILSSMDNFSGALQVVQEGLASGLMKAETADKAIAKTYARQVVAQREAEADARANLRLQSRLAVDQEKLKTEQLKQRKYQREEIAETIKTANSPMTAAEKSALADQVKVKLLADENFGKDLPENMREAFAETQSAIFVESESASRDRIAVAENRAIQAAQVLSFIGQGHGDTAWENVLWARDMIKSGQLAAPEGTTPELIDAQISLLQNSTKFTPESLNAALRLNVGYAPQRSTDMALYSVGSLRPEQIPVDANGKVDEVRLSQFLAEKHVTNFDYNKILNAAQSKADTVKDPTTAILEETYLEDALKAILSERAEDWLDENFEDVDVLDTFDFSIEPGGDPAATAAGAAVIEQVLYDAREAAKAERKRNPAMTPPQLQSFITQWVRGEKGKQSFTLHLRQSLADHEVTDLDTELSLGAAQLEEARD